MTKFSKQIKTPEDILYNSILFLSRNKLFYTKFYLSDTFQNRINLIFLHISFLFIKIKQNNNKRYKFFYQNMFDLIFIKIEQNMREIGYGDTVVNKNMKFLVKNFYDILLNCEKYNEKTINLKNIFFLKFFEQKNVIKDSNNKGLIDYFNKYQVFCLDLSIDSVLKGSLKFNFNYT